MPDKTATKRQAGYRARHNMRSVSLRADALEALSNYKIRAGLRNQSDALIHAIKNAER